jgi:hypothetical protein
MPPGTGVGRTPAAATWGQLSRVDGWEPGPAAVVRVAPSPVAGPAGAYPGPAGAYPGPGGAYPGPGGAYP